MGKISMKLFLIYKNFVGGGSYYNNKNSLYLYNRALLQNHPKYRNS